jgi:hypothetical protein
VLQRCGDHDFPVEPLHAQARRKRRWQQLDDDLAIQAMLVGEEDPRHATAAQLSFERVGGA